MAEESLRFYLDEHVDVEIARQLNNRGIDTVTVQDLETQGTDDPIQLRIATDQGRVFCTLDRHFIDLAATGIKHSGIVFIPSAHRETGVVVKYLTLMAGAICVEEARNRVEYVSRLD